MLHFDKATYWIQNSWLEQRRKRQLQLVNKEGDIAVNALALNERLTIETGGDVEVSNKTNSTVSIKDTHGSNTSLSNTGCWNISLFESNETQTSMVLSPRRQKALEQNKMMKRVVRFVTSPFPYAILILLFAMIVMIFIDVMPISGLICVFAIVMVITVVLGNHCRNRQIWIEESDKSKNIRKKNSKDNEKRDIELNNTDKSSQINQTNSNYKLINQITTEDSDNEEDLLGPLTKEDKIDNLNEFFEALFNSIDYSLLIIFLGLFIVVEDMASTGIPKTIW